MYFQNEFNLLCWFILIFFIQLSYNTNETIVLGKSGSWQGIGQTWFWNGPGVRID